MLSDSILHDAGGSVSCHDGCRLGMKAPWHRSIVLCLQDGQCGTGDAGLDALIPTHLLSNQCLSLHMLACARPPESGLQRFMHVSA